MRRASAGLTGALLLALTQAAAAQTPAAQPVINPPPTAQAWADLAKLPDWSGVWLPKPLAPKGGIYVPDDNLPVWTPKAAQRVQAMIAADRAGNPDNIYLDCLPEGMPSFVLMTLNAVEFLFTPGRVTLLSEFDGNRNRRIYTDGRGHPEDPDLTFNGHSIGHWEGQTLVVDSVGFLPQVFIPVGQAVGVPNNGDLHVIERIHLTGPDTLQDDLEIIAPKVLAKPWITSRVFNRKRERAFDIVEGSCRQGDFNSDVDADGFAIFKPIPFAAGGAPLPHAQSSK